ncbi:hypothetical protein Cadr_000023278 [Camelus dromedarius]|uniref:Uncharacterized protein n=1 Tax=Camelus dromedarius TaxID=9838 RepID=A0A5N4CKS0_CAMDR|nr:hypothetical protein Cadr_000023278 [Camelus dromedarius]
MRRKTCRPVHAGFSLGKALWVKVTTPGRGAVPSQTSDASGGCRAPHWPGIHKCFSQMCSPWNEQVPLLLAGARLLRISTAHGSAPAGERQTQPEMPSARKGSKGGCLCFEILSRKGLFSGSPSNLPQYNNWTWHVTFHTRSCSIWHAGVWFCVCQLLCSALLFWLGRGRGNLTLVAAKSEEGLKIPASGPGAQRWSQCLRSRGQGMGLHGSGSKVTGKPPASWPGPRKIRRERVSKRRSIKWIVECLVHGPLEGFHETGCKARREAVLLLLPPPGKRAPGPAPWTIAHVKQAWRSGSVSQGGWAGPGGPTSHLQPPASPTQNSPEIVHGCGCYLEVSLPPPLDSLEAVGHVHFARHSFLFSAGKKVGKTFAEGAKA